MDTISAVHHGSTLRQRSTAAHLSHSAEDAEVNDAKSDTDKECGDADGLQSVAWNNKCPPALVRNETGNEICRSKWSSWQLLALLTFLGFLSRFWNFAQPHSVVFDEVHFGGFASNYIKRTFFFDVHPPTGKLLIALAGWLGGYDGSFTFKEIHQDYLKQHVPYMAMRAVPALCGALTVPLAYVTLHAMGCSVIGAVLAAVMVLLENSFVTQSRFILLDSILLFFIALAVYSHTKFQSYWTRPFTFQWWLWLAMTGVSLGLAAGVKYVGIFVISYIGIQTVYELWVLLGRVGYLDRYLSGREWWNHFAARAVCLIGLPVAIYVASFYIHLEILKIDGPGTSVMKPEFKEGLYMPVVKTPLGIVSGDQIMLKLTNDDGELIFLHSHPNNYVDEHSSKQQQITGYGHRDHNNWFSVTLAPEEGENTTQPQPSDDYVRGNAQVRLTHVATDKALYVHGHEAPVTKQQGNTTLYEVSASDGIGDRWRLELIGRGRQDYVVGWRERVRLTHVEKGCVLSVSAERLPEWGFFQNEVLCVPGSNVQHSVWSVEATQASKVAAYQELRPPLKNRSDWLTRLHDIVDLNFLAWELNKQLTDTHVFQSRPETWPLLKRGISYWQNGSTRCQVYLLGNPLVWWTILFAPPLYCLISLVLIMRKKRGYRDLDVYSWDRFTMTGLLWLCSLLHFLPFFLMRRQLFLHHYLPAHYFNILAFAAFTDQLTGWLFSPRGRLAVAAVLGTCFLFSFWMFAPLSYATPLTQEQIMQRKWLPTWDMM